MTPIDSSLINPLNPNPLSQQGQKELIEQEIVMGMGLNPVAPTSGSSNQSASTQTIDNQAVDNDLDDSVNANIASSVTDQSQSMTSTLTQDELDTEYKHKRRNLTNICINGKL